MLINGVPIQPHWKNKIYLHFNSNRKQIKQLNILFMKSMVTIIPAIVAAEPSSN